MNPVTAAPSTATSNGYTPTGTVVVDDDTVQGQLDKVLSKDSKLIQRADARSRSAMAGNGMINSSMGVQAGQAAVIDAALPIAQQDASTYFTANQKTVDAKNAALNFEAGASNQKELANAQLKTDVSKTNAGMINEAGARNMQAANDQMLARLDAGTRTAIAGLDANTRTALANIDAQNRQLLQSNANTSAMFGDVVKNIAGISVDPSLSKEAKDDAVQTQLNLLKEGLRANVETATTLPANIESLNLDQFFNIAV
ncbi:MAG: hypothetical protein ABIU97_07360 [Dehalococcoidia bacterium]